MTPTATLSSATTAVDGSGTDRCVNIVLGSLRLTHTSGILPILGVVTRIYGSQSTEYKAFTSEASSQQFLLGTENYGIDNALTAVTPSVQTACSAGVPAPPPGPPASSPDPCVQAVLSVYNSVINSGDFMAGYTSLMQQYGLKSPQYQAYAATERSFVTIDEQDGETAALNQILGTLQTTCSG
jgi:hypothetical protein